CGSRGINDAIQRHYEINCARVDKSLRPIRPPEVDFGHMENLRVLVQGNSIGRSQENLHNLASIYSSPLFQALSTQMVLFEWGLQVPTSLTHLELECPWYAQPILRLPLLKVLFIHLSKPQKKADDDTPTDPVALDQWELPRLVTLRMSGVLDETIWERTQQMIIHCSHTLINLVSKFDIAVHRSPSIVDRHSPLRLLIPLLDICRHLKTFAVPVFSLTQDQFSSPFAA
ncbi:hypothetical protein FRC17_007344, partial [Serendipita sp. 399]